MSNTKPETFSYRLIRGCIKKPGGRKRSSVSSGDFYMQGDLLPDSEFGEADIQSWLDEGRVEPALVSPVQAAQEQAITVRGKFCADPGSLVGKSLAELRIMIGEIEPNMDLESITDERIAVSLLTSDYDPRFKRPIAPATDRSRPEMLVAHDMEQGKDGTPVTSSNPGSAMSEKASKALEDARAKAQSEEAASSDPAEADDRTEATSPQKVEMGSDVEDLEKGGDEAVMKVIQDNKEAISKAIDTQNDVPAEQNDVPSEEPQSAIERARAKAKS